MSSKSVHYHTGQLDTLKNRKLFDNLKVKIIAKKSINFLSKITTNDIKAEIVKTSATPIAAKVNKI